MVTIKILLNILRGGFRDYALRLGSLRNFGLFIRQRRTFIESGGEIRENFPVLEDYEDQAGTMSGHYFHQDLLVAQKINTHNPKRHIDVGSRIDGFVAHVASFRPLEIIDIRPTISKVKNISFIQADMSSPSTELGTTDSLSCLHVLEHFGLGRYGDSIDPNGHLLGFKSLISLLDKGAKFYLSFPISNQERVAFNAHRVFHPASPLSWPGSDVLELESFSYVDDSGDLHHNTTIEEAVLSNLWYGCGIYTFYRR
jgi:hypothetical protein